MNEKWKALDEFCHDVLAELVTLQLIVNRRGVKRAAVDLDIAQPAVRQRITKVEASLRGKILEEKSRKGNVTPLGSRMVALAKVVLHELEDFLSDADRMLNSKDIRVASITSAWSAEKHTLEEVYKKQVPSGSLIPAHAGDDYYSIESEVREGRADIGIVSYPPPPRKVAAPIKMLPWRQEQMVYVVSNRRKLMRPITIAEPNDFEEHDTFLTLYANHPMAKALATYLSHHRAHFSRKLSYPSIASIKQAVRDDDGVSILPEPTLREEIADQKVKTFPLKHELLRPVAIIYRADSMNRTGVRVFLECLKQVKQWSK